MKTKRILLLFLVLCLGLVITAQEESGLSFVQLTNGETVINAFEDDVNAQLYVFFGSAGDIVTITMEESPDSLLDPYLVLLGSAGEVYAAADDIEPSSDFSAEISTFELPEDGVYFVLATSFTGLRRPNFVPDGEDDPGPQFYEITINGNFPPEDLEDNGEFEFFRGEFEIGDANTLEITEEEPVFYVTFTAEEGDVVTLRTEPVGDVTVDTALHLFDPEGNRVAVNDDGEGLGLYSEIAGYEIPVDGTYLVFATAYNFNDAVREDWSDAGEFVLVIE